MALKTNCKRKTVLVFYVKKTLEKSETDKKYIGESVWFFTLKYLKPFTTYTMITGTSSLMAGHAFGSATHPFPHFLLDYIPMIPV